MNRKVKFLIGIVILIVVAISIYLISHEEPEPPPAILKIDGKEQISGIGSYCWEERWNALCVDMIGLPTPKEPLLASSPFTAHLTLPLQEPPYELRLYVVRVKDEDEINFSGQGWRWWKMKEEKVLILPLVSGQDIELSTEPGLYVLNIDAWWNKKGSASYGFLVEVGANGTDMVPETPVSVDNQTPPMNNTTFPTIMAIKPDAGSIGTKVVITGAGFTAGDNNVAFRLAPEDAPAMNFKIGYINNLKSSDGRTIEFLIPEVLGACAFPLPQTIPVTGCPAIGLTFKPGTQTYPAFVVNQKGTSNNVNFTMVR